MAKYKYYWNSQTDEHGRNRAMWDGYESGDELTLAYAGEIDCDEFASDINERLFEMFNVDELRPADYRGPSMSVGSVIVVEDGQPYGVASVGFEPVDICASCIKLTPYNWLRNVCCNEAAEN